MLFVVAKGGFERDSVIDLVQGPEHGHVEVPEPEPLGDLACGHGENPHPLFVGIQDFTDLFYAEAGAVNQERASLF